MKETKEKTKKIKKNRQENNNAGSNVKKTQSIGFKMILISALTVAIPIILIVIVTAVRVSNKMKSDIVITNEKQAQIIEQEIAATLDANVTMLKTFASSPDTVKYVDERGNVDDKTVKNVTNELVYLDEMMGDGNVTAITSGTGIQLAKSKGDLVEVSEREYFKQAMKGTVYVSDINVSKSNGSRISTFAVPVTDLKGTNIIGIVQRNYDLAVFHEFLKGELTEKKQEIVMVDRTGSVIAHSGHEIDPENPEDMSGEKFYIDAQGESTKGSYVTTKGGKTWMVSWEKEPNTGWIVASSRLQAVALSEINNTVMLTFIIGLICLFAALVIIFFFSKRIANPISNVEASILQLSAGNLSTDFNEKVLSNKDETGEIGRSAKTLADKLHSVISQTKEMAGSLKSSGTELANSANMASDASTQVTEAVDEISRGSVSKAESIQDAAENTANIGTDIDDITNDVSQLNQFASEMKASCDQVTNTMEELIVQSNDVSESVKEIGETIRSTNDSANEISKFSESIQEIASQTNLLSLNASIEAARAGEAGRGFAVVADEIRDLADQSRSAADEIKRVVDVLLTNAEASTEVMKKLDENLLVHSEKLNTTHTDMNDMTENVMNVSASADHISGKISGLNEAKSQLIEIIDDLSAISEENAASTEQTNASMQELNATFSIINESADKLQKLADDMNSTIDYFSL